MKTFAILTLTAMATVATSSGCRTCGSPFNFNSFRPCEPAGAEVYDSYSPSYEAGASYGPGVIYEGDTLLPPPVDVLPGPRDATP